MHMLMLTQVYPPHQNPEAFCTGKFVKELLAAGHSVSAITSQGSMTYGEHPIDSSPVWAECTGKIHSLKQPHGLVRGLVRLVLGDVFARAPGYNWWTKDAYRYAKELLSRTSVDLLVTGYEVYNTSVIGTVLKKQSSLPWLVRMNDPSPLWMCPPPYGIERPSGLGQRMVAHRVSEALARADGFVFPCERLAKHTERVYGLTFGKRVTVIPHIGWRSEHEVASRMGGDIRILHSGNLGGQRASTEVFKVFSAVLETVKRERLGARLVFEGHVAPSDDLGRFLKNHEERVEVVPTKPYMESLASMAQASALLLVEALLEDGIFLPSKLADYAVSGKPVLMFSPENGTVADLVGGYKHPGFLGQNPEKAAARMIKFMRKAVKGEDLSEYKFPNPEIFEPKYVITKFMADLRELVPGLP